MPLLSVKDLSIETISRSPISLLKNISFDMQAGETLCVVGESGSGKSLTALSIMRLLPEDALQVVSGEIMVDGHHIINASKEEVLGLRGTLMSMVFQEPMTALNPIQRVGHQIDEAIRIHRRMTE